MLIIFGRKTVETTVQRGSFICPNCNADRSYVLKKCERYFSLFFIPVIPLGKEGDVLECVTCRAKYAPGSILSKGEYTPESQLVFTDTPDLITASPGKRISAYLIDMVLLIILNFPLAILIGKLPEHISSFLNNRFYIAFAAMWILYFFFFECLTGGYTIGKKLLSVRTRKTKENKSISLPAAFIRSIVKVVPVIHFIFLFTDKNRAVHDFAAGSIVVEKM